MTFAIFLSLFSVFVFAVLNILPAMPVTPTGFLSSFTYLVGLMKSFDWIIPFTDVWICISLILGAIVARWLWRATVFVITMVRGGTSP